MRHSTNVTSVDKSLGRLGEMIVGYEAAMEREDRGQELHTEADDEEPLSPREEDVLTIYGDVDEGFENEDQADAHHAEPGEHL